MNENSIFGEDETMIVSEALVNFGVFKPSNNLRYDAPTFQIPAVSLWMTFVLKRQMTST